LNANIKLNTNGEERSEKRELLCAKMRTS